MNHVTLAIPGRWGKASARILRFLRNRDRLRTASIERFEIKKIPPLDEGQIWAFESSLSAAQAIFVDASIAAMNVALNDTPPEGLRAIRKVTEQAKRDVEEIESIVVAAVAS